MARFLSVLVWATLWIADVSSAQSSPSMGDIAASHIEANIPSQDQFDALLKRDLDSYFARTLGKSVETTYEMLRDGPTQTGISYPKYYVWVKVYENSALLDEGAARLAAVDKVQFEVTNFINKKEIRANPQLIGTIFPAALVPKIESKGSQ